jgi:hypothetical protein
LAALHVPPVMVCANIGAVSRQEKESRMAVRVVFILEPIL